MVAIYKVKGEICRVLKRRDLVMKDVKGRMQKEKLTFDQVYPSSLVTTDRNGVAWVNVTANMGNELRSDEYEPARLFELHKNGVLELMEGESLPDPLNKALGNAKDPIAELQKNDKALE